MKRDIPWRQFGKELVKEVRDDHLPNGAAALAFYMVLALFPAATFALSLLPYLPIPNLQEAIMELVRQAMPGAAADMFTSTVTNVVSRRSGGLLSFGLLFAIWSASSGLYALMQQLNVVNGVTEERPFWRARGVAILLTLLFFVLIVGTLGLVVFGGMLQTWLGEHLGWSSALLATFAVFRWVVIVAALHLSLALVYRIAPNVARPFKLVTPGTVFAAFGLLGASFAFKLYVSNFGNYDAVYGSLGAVIVLLMWLLVTGWVILLGAEIDVVADRHAGGSRPEAQPPGASAREVEAT